jgi:aryl-alcohol dehydrogenase-like predicted oxidoreductase
MSSAGEIWRGKFEEHCPVQSKVVIGTASWGSEYGLFNSAGADVEAAKSILEIALSGGVTAIDTAPAYGDSESILGGCELAEFDLHTKIDSKTWDRGADYTLGQLRESLGRLGIERLKGLTFHSAESFLGDPKRAMEFVSRIRAEGLAQNWGVSVYEPFQVMEIMRFAAPDYIQAPVNLLDRRFLASSFLERIGEKSVGLQARSIFLQGLLLQGLGGIPRQFKPWADLFSRYSSLALEHGISRFEFALLPVLQDPAVQTAVVGVNEESHIRDLVTAVADGISVPSLSEIESMDDLDLIDPRKWRK